MSFESKVVAFSDRFLSVRSHELIIAPALADLQFEREEQGTGSRLAVLLAVMGALRIDLANQAGMFVFLTLVPACYYFVLIAVCFDFFSATSGKEGVLSTVAGVAAPLLMMSLVLVTVCFWPERRVANQAE
jgi:hypothetical protein